MKTRWNTTIDLLSSLVTNYAPISALVADPLNSSLKKNLPDEYEVSLIYDMIHLLEPLKELTNALSGYHYSTTSSILPSVYFLIHEEMSELPVGDDLTEQARECLYVSLVYRFEYLLEDNLDMFLAITMLDSRYKCFDFVQNHDTKIEYQVKAKNYLLNFNEKCGSLDSQQQSQINT